MSREPSVNRKNARDETQASAWTNAAGNDPGGPGDAYSHGETLRHLLPASLTAYSTMRERRYMPQLAASSVATDKTFIQQASPSMHVSCYLAHTSGLNLACLKAGHASVGLLLNASIRTVAPGQIYATLICRHLSPPGLELPKLPGC